MVLSDRTPVATRQKAFVVPYSPVDIMREHGNHVFVCFMVEMVNFVAFVENIAHHFWRGRIYDS